MGILANLIMCLCLTVCSCSVDQHAAVYNIMSGKDRNPPIFQGIETRDSSLLVIEFNEAIECSIHDVSIDQVDIDSLWCEDHLLFIRLASPLLPGKPANFTARVCDITGNSMRFSTRCWGKNERLPSVLINEFTTKGNANHPDRIELICLEEGNLAGLSVYDGIGYSFDSEFIFPSFEVSSGTYVVLHYSSEPTGSNAWEFYGGSIGLGSNNGVLSLYECPQGRLIDAVAYSNRTSDSDEQYGGFGTKKVFERMLILEESGFWKTPLHPEDAIDSTYTTATRSMCRSNGTDTDSKHDWHVVPTSKASFGSENCQEVYVP
ncbi:MAG: hypothetical protein WCR91_07275 [Sphaerochaetaceae bacterium]|nr:hypothetical protein [Sphaerochaetaceae bacterium]